ncbi:hypothetical protein [Burkholderia thailandensis]|uniref:hypothetical protein n=1 Tax=Burkholderia thailandensis TaxID=57975 RepID=UPI0011855DD6|nr:hypothetical protein [Burkholderia thailandensis]
MAAHKRMENLRPRASEYKPEYAERARNYCLLGATESELGPLLGVTRRTILNWKKKYPDLAEAIAEGTLHANANVIGAHYRKCLEGDMTAIIFWEKNKMGWRDKLDVDANLNGKLELTNLTNASDEQLDKIISERLAYLGFSGKKSED